MRYILLLLLPLQLFAQQPSLNPDSEPQLLEVNKMFTRELVGVSTHSYKIELKYGEFLNASVNQKGKDVSVRIVAPDSSTIAEIDSPNGDNGEEPIRLEAKLSGTYFIHINSSRTDTRAGQYEIKINEILSPEDNSRRLAEVNRKQQAVVKWIKANLIPVKTVESGKDFSDLQPFKKILKDVHYIGLGEATHGTSEFFQFKNRMLQFLVKEMGFRVFTIEAGYSSCQQINDYVLGRTEKGKEALDSMGYWLWNTEEIWAMIDWMRAYNRTLPAENKIRFIGFDIQNNLPGQAKLIEYLNRTAPKEAEKYEELLRTNLGPLFEHLMDNNKKTDAAAKLENLRRSANDLYVFLDLRSAGVEGKEKRDEHAEMRELARVMVQHIDAYFTNGLQAVTNLRDLYMADNFRRIVSREPAGTKFVIWAHNGHLATTTTGGYFTTIGHHLRRFYGQSYYALGFSFNKGGFQARLADPAIIQRTLGTRTPLKAFTVSEAPIGSIDWHLAQTKQNMFIIDFRLSPKNVVVNEWLYNVHPMRYIGGSYAAHQEGNKFNPTVVGKEFDGLFFIDTTKRARPRQSVVNVVQ